LPRLQFPLFSFASSSGGDGRILLGSKAVGMQHAFFPSLLSFPFHPFLHHAHARKLTSAWGLTKKKKKIGLASFPSPFLSPPPPHLLRKTVWKIGEKEFPFFPFDLLARGGKRGKWGGKASFSFPPNFPSFPHLSSSSPLFSAGTKGAVPFVLISLFHKKLRTLFSPFSPPPPYSFFSADQRVCLAR